MFPSRSFLVLHQSVRSILAWRDGRYVWKLIPLYHFAYKCIFHYSASISLHIDNVHILLDLYLSICHFSFVINGVLIFMCCWNEGNLCININFVTSSPDVITCEFQDLLYWVSGIFYIGNLLTCKACFFFFHSIHSVFSLHLTFLAKTMVNRTAECLLPSWGRGASGFLLLCAVLVSGFCRCSSSVWKSSLLCLVLQAFVLIMNGGQVLWNVFSIDRYGHTTFLLSFNLLMLWVALNDFRFWVTPPRRNKTLPES